MEISCTPTDNKKDCTGLKFRSSKSTYFKDGVLGERKQLRLLKRVSCSCQECSYILDQLKEYDFGCTSSWLNEVEDGEFYTLIPSWDYDDSYLGISGTYLEEFTLQKVR